MNSKKVIKTSTGKIYNLSQLEQDWVAGFGDKSSSALLSIRLSLVYSMQESEWLTDLCVDDAEFILQMNDLLFSHNMTLEEYCRSTVERLQENDITRSEVVELGEMPDGTPCGLKIWRGSRLDQGLGVQILWMTSTLNAEDQVTSIASGYHPSVLSVKRSGLFPGITPDQLQQIISFRQEMLPREQSYDFFLVGFPFTDELEEAEICVRDALSDFPGSTLSIISYTDPDDPQIIGKLHQRGVNSVPHLQIFKGMESLFRLDGPFDVETLTRKLDERFYAALSPSHYDFKLCDDCLKQYRALIYDSASWGSSSQLPDLPTLYWNDEHPEGSLRFTDHNYQCNDWVFCLIAARNYLWEHGSISEKHQFFWYNAQKLIPDWPGFQRLILEGNLKESYNSSTEEAQDIRDSMASTHAEIGYRCLTPGFVKWRFTSRHRQ